MPKTNYKDKLLEEVKTLSEERVKALVDFARYLKEREEWEATAEILGNVDVVRQVRESRKAWAEGQREKFITLDELRAKLNV